MFGLNDNTIYTDNLRSSDIMFALPAPSNESCAPWARLLSPSSVVVVYGLFYIPFIHSIDRNKNYIHRASEYCGKSEGKMESVLNNCEYVPGITAKECHSRNLDILVLQPFSVHGRAWCWSGHR